MADRLTTPEKLASLLERDDLDAYKAGLLVDIGTAVVQRAAGGQRIVAVAADTFEVMGTNDPWLDLPQIPVTNVASVLIDGIAPTRWKRIGNRLWSRCGWNSWNGHWCDEPSNVTGVYDHGYADETQDLVLGDGAVLSLVKGAFDTPGGLTMEKIDDYQATFDALAAQMAASPYLENALRQQYGRKAGLVRIG